MEIFIFPILVFLFVVSVLLFFNRLTSLKKKMEIKKQAWQSALKQTREETSANRSLNDLQQDYEKSVMAFNRAIKTFPTSIMAAVTGYKEIEI